MEGYTMSGSGGGGSSSDAWRPALGGADNESKCDIRERTILNSPNPEVVSKLRAGEILKVICEKNPDRLVAKNSNGEPAGAITSRSIVEILECINDGSEYVAEVLTINAGRVDVEVRLK